MKKSLKIRFEPIIGLTKLQIFFLVTISILSTVTFYYLIKLLWFSVVIAIMLYSSQNKVLLPFNDLLLCNFITASFACIFGLSVFIKHYFIKIKVNKKNSLYKRKHIISDVSMLFTGFYLFVINSVFLIYQVYDGFLTEDFNLKNIKFIWFLLIIVMYFEIWKTITLIYGKKAIFKMILMIGLMLPCAFGLSRLEVNDINIFIKFMMKIK